MFQQFVDHIKSLSVIKLSYKTKELTISDFTLKNYILDAQGILEMGTLFICNSHSLTFILTYLPTTSFMQYSNVFNRVKNTLAVKIEESGKLDIGE
jgi:uncharacterized protein (DUF1778 family)